MLDVWFNVTSELMGHVDWSDLTTYHATTSALVTFIGCHPTITISFTWVDDE